MPAARPLRWREDRGAGMGPRTHTLRRGEEEYATVQQASGGGGWFWYASVGKELRNTASESRQTLQEAKDAAAAWVRAELARQAAVAEPPPVPREERSVLSRVQHAASDGCLCLLSVVDRQTGKPATLLAEARVEREGGPVDVLPLALVLDSAEAVARYRAPAGGEAVNL